MHVSHTSAKSMLAEGSVIERDFRKRDEEKLAYASMQFPSSSTAITRTRPRMVVASRKGISLGRGCCS
jgi:hypothetical protein